jgi:hypothetical protein
MPRSRKLAALILAALPLLVCSWVRAAPEVPAQAARAADRALEPAKYMRFVDDGHAGGKFEVATVTYRNKDGVTVRLVGAIHIGEKSYYDSLNRSFENDDAVLYEMVKPKDAGVPEPGQRSDNPINQFQHMLKDVLDLDFQLDDIDYSKPNFVHADMDAETFAKMQEERGETFQELILKQVMKAMLNPPEHKQGDEPDADKTLDSLVEMLTRPDMERQIKLQVARQLDKMEADALGLNGPNGSVIVTERNKVALKVLDQTIAQGRKKISIFYGAAHLPDMSARLREKGFTPVQTEWLTAWDLTIRSDQPSAAERLLKELIHALDD